MTEHINEYAEFDCGNLKAWSNPWGEIVIGVKQGIRGDRIETATIELDAAAALAEWIQSKVDA